MLCGVCGMQDALIEYLLFIESVSASANECVPESVPESENRFVDAILRGNVSKIKYLLEKYHCDVNEKDDWGFSPLHYAAIEGNLDIVKFLVEDCHCDVNLKNYYGENVLSLAAESHNFDVVKYLIENDEIYCVDENELFIAFSSLYNYPICNRISHLMKENASSITFDKSRIIEDLMNEIKRLNK